MYCITMTVKNTIVPKRELKCKVKVAEIFIYLKEEFKDMPHSDLIEIRLNPDLIKHICQLVESNIAKKTNQIKRKLSLI
jgi:hypothetical protein